MAATGNEVPLLSQLVLLKEWIDQKLKFKIDAPPMVAPEDGDILCYRSDQSSSPGTIWRQPDEAVPNATASADGLMSAADKVKLDGLPSSFTAPAVDIVKVTEHKVDYSKDTLEIVVDSTGQVTSMYFVSV